VEASDEGVEAAGRRSAGGGGLRRLAGPVDSTPPQVLTVEHRLVQKLGDVVVVQRVHDAPAATLPLHQAEVAQQP
jgi:hypothetical protein